MSDTSNIVYDESGNVIFDPGSGSMQDWGGDQPSQRELSAAQSFYQSISNKAHALDTQIARLSDMQAQYDAVRASIADNAELVADWQANYNKIILANTVIENARSAINQVASWWQTVSNAVGGANNLQGLGFIVAIPWGAIGIVSGAVAAVAALVASLGYSLNRYRQYALQQLNAARAAQGLPPISDASPDTSGGFLSSLGGNLGLILGAAIVYFFLIKE